MSVTPQLPEPLIVGYGRTYINEYSPSEFRGALIRAFKERAANFIVLDDHTSGQRFVAAGVAWAIDQGLLYHAQSDGDAQSNVHAFRLTDKGRAELL